MIVSGFVYSVIVSNSQLRPPRVLQSVDRCIRLVRFEFFSISVMSFCKSVKVYGIQYAKNTVS